MKKIYDISNAYPLHIGQNKLNHLIFNQIDRNKYFIDCEFLGLQKSSNHNYNLTLKNSENKSFNIESKIIVGCEGAHSELKKIINSQNIGINNIQTFVNAHFISKSLAEHLKKIKKESMLHFIFNPRHVCVLISYDYDLGEFVLQIPYFQGIDEEKDFTKERCQNIIFTLLSQDIPFHIEIVK